MKQYRDYVAPQTPSGTPLPKQGPVVEVTERIHALGGAAIERGFYALCDAEIGFLTISTPTKRTFDTALNEGKFKLITEPSVNESQESKQAARGGQNRGYAGLGGGSAGRSRHRR